MKFFTLTVVLAVCAVAQASTFAKAPTVTRLENYESNEDETRIIGGQPAKQGQFPWQVAIRFYLDVGLVFCGGSLISPRWILTAQHCISSRKIVIKLGGIHRNATDDEPGSIVVNASTVIRHELYNKYKNNDIALIKLDQDIPFSDTIQPIRLPALSEVNNPLVNVKVNMSGWGKTGSTSDSSPDLNFVELTTITNERCAQTFGDNMIISSTICTGGRTGHNPCNGDSGGPLVRIAEDGIATLVGVDSFVYGAGCFSGMAGYGRVSSHLEWISKHTGIPIRP